MFIAIQTGSRCHDHDQVSDNIRFDALRGREIARSLNRLCHVQALYHVPKQVIQFFERLRVISRADEELAAVRIRASISHRHHTHCITAFYRLIIELITRSTNEGPHRVTRLDDDMRYDAVEGLTIIKCCCARNTKLFTVFGASFGSSSSTIKPRFVLIPAQYTFCVLMTMSGACLKVCGMLLKVVGPGAGDRSVSCLTTFRQGDVTTWGFGLAGIANGPM